MSLPTNRELVEANYARLERDIADLRAELEAYRASGVTEELLRRHDGYIKIGRGCVVVVAEEYARWKQLLKGEPS